MSFGRKTYDGDFPGRYISTAERGDTFGGKSKAFKPIASKRTIRNDELLDPEESPFYEGGDKDRYLITYADLITLLLGLFIILYAISNIDANKYKRMISAVGNVFGNRTKIINVKSNLPPIKTGSDDLLKNKLLQLIDKYHYNNSIILDENKRGITIHILDNILFKSGSADLTSSSLLVLDRLAVILKALPNDIRVEGHTDNVPINTPDFPSNWHLSVTRALNTAYFLIHNEQLPPEKISIVGYSKYKPIDSNNTVAGRANNRRVDIVIIKK
jgi:chemotaxis protein MotB